METADRDVEEGEVCRSIWQSEMSSVAGRSAVILNQGRRWKLKKVHSQLITKHAEGKDLR